MEPAREAEKWWMFWKRRRHVVALLAFFGFFNVYSLRVNLSVAIVAMTSTTEKIVNGTSVKEPAEFELDSRMQGLVLSSFFYGYICTQLIGGLMAAKIGGARIFCGGIAFTAVATVITPPIAKASVYMFVALRIIEGLFEGVTYPCIHAVWSRWAPQSERATMAAFAFSGSYVGTVVTLSLSGMLANTFGWPSVFYVTGAIGILWCLIWTIYVYEKPEDDPRISEAELKYLQETIGDPYAKKVIHPWKEFFKSLPVWAIVLAHFSENWGFYTLLTQLPTFMKDILDFDIKEAGFLSSMPYLVMAIVMQFAGRLADWMCNRNILSVTNVRKLFNGFAFISQAICMMMAGYLLSPTGVIVCLVFAVGLGAFAWPAFSINHLDLAPQHASVLLGISNTFATLPGIVSPLLTGFIVTDKTADQWRIVFYIASSIYLVGCVFYVIFGSGQRQWWAEDQETETSMTKSSDEAKVSVPDLPVAHTAPEEEKGSRPSTEREPAVYNNEAFVTKEE